MTTEEKTACAEAWSMHDDDDTSTEKLLGLATDTVAIFLDTDNNSAFELLMEYLGDSK